MDFEGEHAASGLKVICCSDLDGTRLDTSPNKSYFVAGAKPNRAASGPLMGPGFFCQNQTQRNSMAEMIVATFDAPSAAEVAIRDPEAARTPSAAVKSYTKDEPTCQECRPRQPEHQGGFWSWLIGEEPTQTQEYGAYDTSLASGHAVVTATVDGVHADVVIGFF